MHRKPIVAVIGTAIATLFVGISVIGCAPSQPSAAPTSAPELPVVEPASSQPSTQPVPGTTIINQGLTPAQVQAIIAGALNNGANVVTTYGPGVQAILALIPQTAGIAAILGIVIMAVGSIKKAVQSGQAPGPADLATFAVDIEQKVASVFPKLQKGGAEFQAVVGAIKSAVAASTAKPGA